MKKGFTLVELMTVVRIIAILSGIALPNYQKSIEKTRATEAMNIVKAANEAVYTYATERNKCPDSFSKLLISIPGEEKTAGQLTAKRFIYYLNSAENGLIPGTNCRGVLADRNSTSVNYQIWNPYTINPQTKKRGLACSSSQQAGIKVCKSLGIYTEQSPA